MNHENRTYALTILALLAACNAGLELSLGNYLHAVKFPLKGSILVGINIIIYTIGYTQVPRKGSILTMGFITALLNLFLSGTFKFWSIPAIFLEALIIELIIGHLGLKFWTVAAASVSANVFSIIWTFVFSCLIMGRGFWETLLHNCRQIVGNSEMVNHYLALAAVFVVVIHVVNGFVFALVAWKARLVTAKISRRDLNVGELG